MEKKNVIFLSVIAVATLLTAVVGATFAYFSAGVSGGPQTNTVTAATLAGATFTGAQSFMPTDGIYPGWIGIQSFTMSIDSSDTNAKGQYILHLDAIVGNGFVAPAEVTYSVYKTTDPDADYFTLTPGTLSSTGSDGTEGQFSKVDTITMTGTPTLVGTADKVLANGTDIVLDTVDYSGGDAATRYYVVYKFSNKEDTDQSVAMGDTFSVSIDAIPGSL